MAFKLKNIDRAIEWALRDAFIGAGYWPDERNFILTDDETGFNNAVVAMSPRVDVFGVGNYTDRGQLKTNNVIISRLPIENGSINFSNPFAYVLQPDSTYTKIKTPRSTSDISYRITLVAYDVETEREINEIIHSVFGNRESIFGMNDDLTNMTEEFWIFRTGSPVDLSGKDFIEKVYQFVVTDVILEAGTEILEEGIQPLLNADVVLNPNERDADVLYPDNALDILFQTSGVVDLFMEFVQPLSGWHKLEMARMYARETEGLALKNLKNGNDAINSGCAFSKFKGFFRNIDTDYINTLFNPSASESFKLTSYSYMVFVTEAPGIPLAEFFGLTDTVKNVSVLFQASNDIGIEVIANSGDVLSDVDLRVKANTLYTLTRRNRFVLELFEGDKIILSLEEQPTDIPDGIIFDLNIADETGSSIGTGTSGGIAFSAAGAGLRGSEIKELNIAIRRYLTRLGVITS